MTEIEKTAQEQGKLIADLKVCELKTELEKRKQDSRGVKSVLIVRLKKYLRDEGHNPDEYRFSTDAGAATGSPKKAAGSKKSTPVKIIPEKEPVEEIKIKVDEEVTEEKDVKVEEEEEEVVDIHSDCESPEPEEQDLRIIEDSHELEELENKRLEEKGTVKDEIKDEEEEKSLVIVLDQNEQNDQNDDTIVSTEEVEEVEKAEEVEEVDEKKEEAPEENEELEGEDEFEEVGQEHENEEKQENPSEEKNEETVADPSGDVETKEGDDEEEEEEKKEESPDCEQPVEETVKTASQSPNDDDDIILDDDEDLLEDPLVEQPLQSEDKKPSAVSTVTTSTSSSSTAPLFGEDTKKTSIWIRGMVPSTKASGVKQLASPFGKVLQAKIFNSKPINGEVKNCFALITFADSNAMEAAIVALHRKDHEGRKLRVEKVTDSYLTGSAERLAQEKKTLGEQKKRDEDAERQEQRKKRAIILAPEGSDTSPDAKQHKERQAIQAPEGGDEKRSNNKRAVIQAPERSRSRDRNDREQARRDRKPIVFHMQPGRERSSDETRRSSGGSKSERDSSQVETRDARRSIAAPSSTRSTRVTPPPVSSRSRGRNEPSLIISARVDTSGCRGGGPVKRSVERSVPNNISTSDLRRNRDSAPRHRVVDIAPNPNYRGVPSARNSDRYETPIYRESQRRPSPPRRNVGGDIDVRGSSRSSHQKISERDMMEMIRRKEEEHRLREEKLQIEREREKMRFEQEKLARAKLELELTKQKLALQQAEVYATAQKKYTGSADRSDRSGRGDVGGSRRRVADDTFSAPSKAKVHSDDRRGGSGSGSSRRESGGGRHHQQQSSIPSARHIATEYGIQSGLGNSSSLPSSNPRGSMGNVGNYASSKMYDQRGSSLNANYTALGSGGGYQQGYSSAPAAAPARFTNSNGYQQQVWAGLDANGQLTMDTQWTAETASASSSASTWQFGNPPSHSRRDYGYSSGRNNY
uniref:SAFB-like transcription modulator n=1 Tax=Caenorhabditis japonica TaxID=281687 RepID=A0A8R1DTY5_CAEJA